VNGVRAAYRKGMGAWVASRDVDILALQEVRAETDDLTALLGDEWDVVHDAATAKGRAGVAIASRHKATIHRIALGADDFDSAGRWLEADYEVDGQVITVVSAYVHSGQDGTPKQREKYKFLDGMAERLPEIGRDGRLAVVLGDLNVGHRTLDIRNWKGNAKKAGFLPKERKYFDRFVGNPEKPGYNAGAGFGWVDVGRRFAGEVDGPTPGTPGAARRSTPTRAGASTTSWPPPLSPRRPSRIRSTRHRPTRSAGRTTRRSWSTTRSRVFP